MDKKFGLVFVLWSSFACADVCPDPRTSSLQWGVPPAPWEISPISNRPQAEKGTRFVSANILVARYGRGIMCTYRNSLGNYSIWQQILTKIPPRISNDWIAAPGGYVCTASLEECQFYTANQE